MSEENAESNDEPVVEDAVMETGDMGKVVDKNCSMDASENEVDVEEDDDIITDMD